jgi:hypothetical protein
MLIRKNKNKSRKNLKEFADSSGSRETRDQKIICIVALP